MVKKEKAKEGVPLDDPNPVLSGGPNSVLRAKPDPAVAANSEDRK